MIFRTHKKYSFCNSTNKGISLIETVVGIAVFVIVALSAYKAFGVLMDAVAASRAKVAATSIANEKFEIIRNLPYDDVGLVDGIPEGMIIRNQTVARDNYSFAIVTTIRNVDDTFDGTIGGSPSDNSPADYKLAELEITCSNCKIFSPLKFITLVAPHALETASTNGALFIQVFDANGSPVQGASVHVENTQTNPDTIIDDTTDNGGWLKIIDAPPGTNAYNISVTKTGYSEDQTYPINGPAGADPLNPDATVVIQQVTQASLSIDRTSSLSVSTVDTACVAIPSVGFSLTGTKIIGTPTVLKYPTEDFTTNSGGTYTVSGLEWDTYVTSLSSVAYDLAGASLLSTFDINPAENKTLQMILAPHVDKALLVSVVDSSNTPIDGALVVLDKTPFSDTKTTNSSTCATPGQVFWNGLEDGTYDLTISKAGYQTSVTTVNISDTWKNEIITLVP